MHLDFVLTNCESILLTNSVTVVPFLSNTQVCNTVKHEYFIHKQATNKRRIY